jgi:hypothetical protein
VSSHPNISQAVPVLGGPAFTLLIIHTHAWVHFELSENSTTFSFNMQRESQNPKIRGKYSLS